MPKIPARTKQAKRKASAKKAPARPRVNDTNTICSCGRPKWWDAPSCDGCWDNGYPDNWLNR